ncbi:MAG: hypothetical protein JGK17_16035 [Microcoleus sp. PH2017_10_PVI_O_A]|uniref:hypothetical protein n=1 Tax=unclassified Microcoleus TaxID=2642155 RepID=UPI001DFBE01D|nr:MULTISPECIES: hypothetical protein [unclassified Microcoleus]TAE80385.1 MAG: hypothetical protein EAZ83_18445 [Oscillatoriales cyanobacterium]MCC3407070.1 hypothetical protein [Microcoleus sp. PH2017_10_PVI_O_A]MCC3461828.1 hypothetical protein [Microcoleus sp. PH2017_11_PCY_U_A]MCC3477971.1 hypothetical protein [Microcoleus sp. PH2017_12_PCY_D_A]MCC3529079.1 hypothetical protein [Microcoleus sp. PH2017_21_RUC_O_A]
MNSDTVATIASILILGAAVWAAALVVLETVAKIVPKLLGVTVAIGLLLVYLQFYWGIDTAYLWQTVKHLPEAFNFSIGA